MDPRALEQVAVLPVFVFRPEATTCSDVGAGEKLTPLRRVRFGPEAVAEASGAVVSLASVVCEAAAVRSRDNGAVRGMIDRPDITAETVDALVSRYADAASAHQKASEQGDHKRANLQHDVVAAVYRELRRRGEAEALLPATRSR